MNWSILANKRDATELVSIVRVFGTNGGLIQEISWIVKYNEWTILSKFINLIRSR